MVSNIKRLISVQVAAFIVILLALTIGISYLSIASAESTQDSNSNTTTQEKTKEEIKAKREAQEKERQAKIEAEKAKIEARKAEVEAKKTEMEAKREENKAKLEDKKLEICKKRESAINKSMQNISDRRNKQLEFLNKVSERTQTFYSDKQLSLANYDALVADVNAKKAAAEQAIDTLKASTVEFKCDGSDPKGLGEAHKAARQPVIDALKDYKQSVKNLITGVKSVAPAKTESAE